MSLSQRLKKSWRGNAGYLLATIQANFASALEYRTSFISQVVGMMINNSLWVVFWTIYFKRFPILNGWTVDDVIVLWAVIAFSFGLAMGLFANVGRLAELITQGQLDYYLVLPKNVLLQVAVSQIRPVNLGDMAFGPVLLALFVPLSAAQYLIFFVAGALGAVIYFSFFLLAGSLAFFIGQSESFVNGVSMTMIHFSTYPTRIFDGLTRIILFTLIPAGFIAEVPVDLIRNFSWSQLGELTAAAAFFAALASFVFYRGLRRYESGNLMVMRS